MDIIRRYKGIVGIISIVISCSFVCLAATTYAKQIKHAAKPNILPTSLKLTKSPKEAFTPSFVTVRGHVEAVYKDHIVIDDRSISKVPGGTTLSPGDDIEMKINRETGEVLSVNVVKSGTVTETYKKGKSSKIKERGKSKFTNY